MTGPFNNIPSLGSSLSQRVDGGDAEPVATEQFVAALYVESGGSYFGLPGVDPWDEPRDARRYAGPHPVVAHPPCQRWGKLWAGQPLWIKRTGQRKIKGDDKGCFAAALAAIREWGGVIEHPWQSHAWPHFNIPVPPRTGGWIATGDGGWTCCVEQRPYGHHARKPTMLLVYGVERNRLPELMWGIGERRLDPAVVARMGLKRAIRLGEVGGKGGGTDSTSRIYTPPVFRELLLGIARSVATEQFVALSRFNGSVPDQHQPRELNAQRLRGGLPATEIYHFHSHGDTDA